MREAIFESARAGLDFPREPGRHKQIVAEIDGGMLPVVEPDASQKDKRKGKTLSWREAKISLAHGKGSRTPIYGGVIEGGVEAAGRQLLTCAVRAGFGTDFAGSRGWRWRAVDRRPDRATVRRAGQLFDRFLSCL